MRNCTDQAGFVVVRNPRNQKRASPPNYWLKLPRDIIIMILQKVGVLDIMLSAQLVCTEWREICTDPSMWATIRLVNWFSYWTPRTQLKLTSDEYKTHLEKMIRRAVDQSCGSLFDLDLDHLMSERLLLYVTERCNQIRRLRGVPRRFIGDVLERVASRLPLLEDLALDYYHYITVETIETLVRCCPRLTSLEISIDDDGAEIIARSLPQLRHLRPMNTYGLTDVGVEALLDGCPHLESLDLYKCKSVTLRDTIGIRCAQKIKNFQMPLWLVRGFYCSTCCGSIGYQASEDDFDYNQFVEEEVHDADDVEYTIHTIEDYRSRRAKTRGREIKIQRLRRVRSVKGNKNNPNSDTKRDQKARRRRDFRTDSRREVKKEFVHWNKIATNPSIYFI